MEITMVIKTSEDFERSMGRIAEVVLSKESLPGRIINATRKNESDTWKEDEDKRRSEDTVDAYIDSLEAGIESFTKI